MSFSPGDRVGPYQILSLLGSGGMGQVYRARDSKLHRDIAIKVLPVEFAHDAERLARFRREAQLLASLNHPNVAAIYGLEDASGDVALALELVDGEDLAQRLARGPLPVSEALVIAKQIAEGLEAAHENGIVHRDLKPANIKVSRDGVAKILDFGLARDAGSGQQPTSVTLANSPTITTPGAITAVGVILGTAAYMSPEQARGGAADTRADLWAFGVLLWEMVTGQQLFGGETVSDVLAAVLTREIPWSALPLTTPSPIRRLLRRCLERDRRKRLGDARTARLEIEDALTGEGERDQIASPPTSSWRRTSTRVVVPTVAITALIVGTTAPLINRPRPAPHEHVTLTIVPPEGIRLAAVGTMAGAPQLAPDGSAVLFKTDVPRGLHVRWLRSMDVTKVPGSDGVSNEAFWHGSSRVTFPIRSGAAQTLVDVRLPDGAPEQVTTYSAILRGGTWIDNDSVLLSGISTLFLSRIGSSLKSIDSQSRPMLYVELIKGTNQLLAWRSSERGEGEVCLFTMRDGAIADTTVLFKNDTAARYTSSGGGRVLFVRNDNLYAQRLNITTRAIEGEPELAVRGVASQPALARADFSVADNGTIAWRPGRAALSQVVTVDRTGKELATSGPAGAFDSIQLSRRDEARLLVGGDTWSAVDAGEAARAILPTEIESAIWSTEGTIVGQRPDGTISRRRASGAEEPIGRVPNGVGKLWALSPDGQFALGQLAFRVAWARVASMADIKAWTPVIDVDESQFDASFSPDGRFVLYEGNGVRVQPFPGPGRRQLVDSGGNDPVWRGDGKEILYVKEGAVWSVSVSASTSGDALTLGTPQRLFGGVRHPPSSVAQSQTLAVSRDGSRIYLVQGVPQPPGDVIHVMVEGARP